ncbi:MAG: hypothetical protein R3F47_11615 [Gammaproteobacteria bacterium]
MKRLAGVVVSVVLMTTAAVAAEKEVTFKVQSDAEGDFVCLHVPFDLMADQKIAQVVKDKGYDSMNNPQVITSGPNMFVCGLVNVK